MFTLEQVAAELGHVFLTTLDFTPKFKKSLLAALKPVLQLSNREVVINLSLLDSWTLRNKAERIRA